MKLLKTAAAAAIIAAAACLPARALVIGTANTGSSLPFGWSGEGYYYQQVYNSAAFTGGAISINELTFYNSAYPGGTPLPGEFKIWLTTTQTPVAGFGNAPFNYSSLGTLVYDGALPSISAGKLDFSLSTAFNYNPGQGNLLLTVENVSLGGSGAQLFLDAQKNTNLFDSHFSAYGYESNTGLVTGFDVTPTPIPAALPLFASGAAAFGLFGWRRRKGKAAQAA